MLNTPHARYLNTLLLLTLIPPLFCKLSMDAHTPAYAVYADQLIHLGHGHPLWQPEPPEKLGEVQIGDVGVLQEGCFYRLFNAMYSHDDPINIESGVPDGFEVLKVADRRLLIQSKDEFLQPGALHATSVTLRKVSGELSLSPYVPVV